MVEQRFLKEVLVKNWYLFAILVAALAVATVQIFRGGGDEDTGQAVVRPAGPEAGGPSGEAQFVFGRRTEAASREEQAKSTIAQHTKKFEDNPDAEDAPGLLSAIGNIYMQKLGNLEEAAQHYERILLDYPDWVGINTVYPQLVNCYEQLDDDQGKRWIYKRIMEDYPPESEEYKYSKSKLGLD